MGRLPREEDGMMTIRERYAEASAWLDARPEVHPILVMVDYETVRIQLRIEDFTRLFSGRVVRGIISGRHEHLETDDGWVLVTAVRIVAATSSQVTL
jgi:hypothetical protein